MIEIKLLARTPAEAIVILAAVQDVLDKKKVPLASKESAAPATAVGGAVPAASPERVAPGAKQEPGAADPKPRQRAERADKGVKRGSYKNVAASAAEGNTQKAKPEGQQPGAAAPQTAASADPPSLSSVANQGAIPEGTASADKAAVPTEAEVQKAIEAAHGRTSTQAMMDLFARYGVRRGRDLLPAQRAEFVAECATLGVTA